MVVYDAGWTLVLANAPYDALMGDTTTWRDLERNAVWRNLTRLPSQVVHTPRKQAEHEARLVAELRLTTSRYSADRGCGA
ncbi:MmyB family transcriptional regulator [Saccharothrix sp. Mg75]|uniref:MmyB family transcriptional regulator n=1 Tax=Saccharothrix sp. Mg75 TaxID=3445357 RepID=UPI003EEEB3CF